MDMKQEINTCVMKNRPGGAMRGLRRRRSNRLMLQRQKSLGRPRNDNNNNFVWKNSTKCDDAIVQLIELDYNSLPSHYGNCCIQQAITEETVTEKHIKETNAIFTSSRVSDKGNGSTWGPAWGSGHVTVDIGADDGSLRHWKISSNEFVFGFQDGSQVYYVTCSSGNAGYLQLSSAESFPANNNPNTSSDKVMVATYDSLSQGFVLQPKLNTSLYIVAFRNRLLAANISMETANNWNIQ